jgi:hypothetical protein
MLQFRHLHEEMGTNFRYIRRISHFSYHAKNKSDQAGQRFTFQLCFAAIPFDNTNVPIY